MKLGEKYPTYPADVFQCEYRIKFPWKTMHSNNKLQEITNAQKLALKSQNWNLKLYCSNTKSTLSRRIPARVISWQSYSSMRCRLWHEMRCSKEASVMRGQLSSSRTVKFSAAHGDVPRWRMPSSVMSSQWDRLCNWKCNNSIQLAYGVSFSYKSPLQSCQKISEHHCLKQKICGPKGEKVTTWRKLHNKGIHKLYLLAYTMTFITPQVKWMENVIIMAQTRI